MAHGMSCYARGCRCDVGRAAKAAYQRNRLHTDPDFAARQKESWAKSAARRLVEMQSDSSDRRHGTEYGYVTGCRCDECRTAHATMRREYSAAKRKAEGRVRYERRPKQREETE